MYRLNSLGGFIFGDIFICGRIYKFFANIKGIILESRVCLYKSDALICAIISVTDPETSERGAQET